MDKMQGLSGLLPLVVLIIVFYFLLIRPQKKKEKAVTAMRNALKIGDDIITIGGICGRVMKVKEESVVIAVGADKTKFEVMKWAISKLATASDSDSDTDVAVEDEAEVQVKKSLPKKIKKKEEAEAQDTAEVVESEE